MVKQLWRDVWRGLNTPISWEHTVKGSVDSLKAIADLAKAIQDNKTAQELAPLVNHFSSLLDVLSSPLGQVATAALPFVPLATGLLKYVVETTRQEPSLEVGVAIAAQTAYLKSVQVFLEQHPELVQRLSDQPASAALTNQIHQLGETLELDGKAVELTEQEARKTLICFHESQLAQIFNGLLSQRLQEAGLSPEEGDRTTERIARSTHRYLKEIVAEVRDQVKRLAAVYGEGWFQDQERYASVDRYLDEVIARKPQETVFDEPFTFADLYVPLQVRPVDREGQVDYRATPQNIETWAETLLQDAQKQGQVLFIQGGPGRGKSVFCRMFADKVRREWSPIWIPLLIRLRDVQNFAQDFDKTLEDAIATDFTKDAGWLTDRNTRFLFFLDGFDELLLERGTTDGLKQFLEQVGLFQKRCADISERGHRVLITGRPLALYGVERLMPLNLERVEIAPMAAEIQQQWLLKWATLAGSEKTQQFQAFLQNQQCPEQVKTLAREPLLLYLLAALHRDDKLQESQLTGDDPVAVRIQIYEAALEWVLTKQRSENGADLNPKITGLDPEDLRSILAEAGLCVVQSGGESAAIALIEERLKEDEGAKQLLAQAKQNAEQNPLKNALAAFYLKSTEGSENQIEFFHKSFGEFLCAERMVESLVRWTKREDSRGKPYLVREEMLCREIYDLFGFGALTQEIVEYLIGLLKKAKPDWGELFKRLEGFYLDWGDGRFIDATEETLPQRKARQLQKYQADIGQRQVDISTGLNVLILLLEIHRYAQSVQALKAAIHFYPCGQPDTEGHDRMRWLRMIHYSDCLQLGTFNQSVGKFLSRAYLSSAYLNSANLSSAVLSSAVLSSADLRNANLSSAVLSRANLSNAFLISADLSRAVLSRADLSNAFLISADLNSADLSRADLSNAFLISADLNSANLSSANLSSANLSRANLSRANLSSTDLSSAYLSSAYLSSANLSSADLSSADLSSANLSNANLSSANLNEIRWDGATHWAGAQGLHAALNVPESLAQTPRFKAAVVLSQGIDGVKQGNVLAAIQAYQEAQTIDTGLEIDAWIWALLCRLGSLHNQSAAVLFAGDNAVALSDWARYRETRGIARALTDDLAGALEDFQVVVAAIEAKKYYRGEKDKQQRQEWLKALQLGQNPFTPEVLEALRKKAGLGNDGAANEAVEENG
ncbi:pentapeptide repeat-containing protein [Leptolyngbya sp. PCC 6406]|uniref:pentapeptide repeat-containing protein n=1 Tax=Leptolyngbya sp. PCC 6406 TaxID=1173264 RepID=UPI0002AD0436|nr:pentapeptide repeat-containing protein [Leptolyngbya sp. PCC 6406]